MTATPWRWPRRITACSANPFKNDKPDIIGHFDVVRKHAKVLGLDTALPAYRRAALDALEAAFQGCRLLEVNTGNIARGYDAPPLSRRIFCWTRGARWAAKSP